MSFFPSLKKILEALKRPATSNSIIGEVEGLRFIAIAGVLLMHMGTQITRINPSIVTEGDWLFAITRNGGVGVNLFFSISGFILAYPFARHYLFGVPKMPLGSFYLKRLTRLEPPFIINIVLLFIMQVVLLAGSVKDLLPHFLASLTYSHYLIYGVWSNINPVTWSLETEIQFYLVAPFLFIGLYAIKKRWVRIALIILVIIAAKLNQLYFISFLKQLHLNKSVIVFIDNFLAGILFLELFLWPGFAAKIKKSFLWDVLALTAIFGFFGIAPKLATVPQGLLMDACVLFIFMGAFKGIVANRFFILKAVTTIGGMCYTIYLYHYAMFAFLSKYTAKIPVPSGKYWVQYLVQGSIMLWFVLVTCSLLFYWFEKPFMVKNWYKKKQLIPVSETAGV